MNSVNSTSLTSDFFDNLYRNNPDPWQFATSEYEAQKYATTLNALPREIYQSGFEIGGSIGVLTEQLATRCRSLLSVDVSQVAREQAMSRCQQIDNIRFELMSVPQDFPAESFDLIVLSEVGYYWSWADLNKAQNLILDRLQPHGHLLLVHWTVDALELPLTGDEVHDSFIGLTPDRLTHLHSFIAPKYRLDLFEKV
jgi:SAM-dependent methyltransferase